MSCGQNHKYDAYQKASDALKSALVAALNSDEETSTLEELFQHYIGARNRADKASSTTSIFGSPYTTYAGVSDATPPFTMSDVDTDFITTDGVQFDFTGIGTDSITTGIGSTGIFNIGAPDEDTITLG